MGILIDSSILIHFEKAGTDVSAYIQGREEEDAFLSVVSVDLYYGVNLGYGVDLYDHGVTPLRCYIAGDGLGVNRQPGNFSAYLARATDRGIPPRLLKTASERWRVDRVQFSCAAAMRRNGDNERDGGKA